MRFEQRTVAETKKGSRSRNKRSELDRRNTDRPPVEQLIHNATIFALEGTSRANNAIIVLSSAITDPLARTVGHPTFLSLVQIAQ